MPLVKQTISLPFTEGVDSKTDPLLSGKPSRVENMVLVGGTWQKRPGTTQLTKTLGAGGSLTAGGALVPFDSELVRFQKGGVYGLAPGATDWVTKDLPSAAANLRWATLTNTRVVRNGRTQENFDQAMVALNGITVFAWDESGGAQQGIHIAVYDEVSGTFYQSGNVAISGSTNGKAPRCVAGGTNVLVFWVDKPGALVKLARIDTTNPLGAAVVSTLRNDFAGPDPIMDACPYNGGAIVVYSSVGGGTTATFLSTDGSGNVVSGPTTLMCSANLINTISANVDQDGNLFVAWSSAVDGATSYFVRKAADLSSVLAQTTIDGTNYTYAIAIGSVAGSPAQTTVVFTSYISTLAYLATATLSKTGLVGSPAAISGSFDLSAVTNLVQHDGTWVLGVVASTAGGVGTQNMPSAYVIDTSGVIIARALTSLSDFPSTGVFLRLGNPLLFSSGTAFLFNERERVAYSSATGTIVNVSAKGITRCLLTAVNPSQLPARRIGDTVYIGGACPRSYDGVQMVETGLPLAPFAPTAGSTGAGNLSAGQYQWRLVYAWTNARGELVRSPASAPLTASPGASTYQNVVAECLTLSQRDLLPAGVQTAIELYRTVANGTLFYKVTSPDSPVFAASHTARNVTIQDNTSDANLINLEPLYTTGGIIDWLSPPAYKYSCIHKTRLVVAGLEDPYAWRSSNTAVFGESLRFHDSIGVSRVPADTGKITGVASMDGNLIIFVERGAYLVAGDGPDLLGNNSWPAPQLIQSVDGGALNQSSVVSLPSGVLFQNTRGIHLLNRGLGVDYLGADVEQTLASPTIRAVVLRPDLEQLWILADTGSDTDATNAGCFVWDYHYNQWSFLRGYGGLSACYYQGKFCRVRSDGNLYQEQPGTYVDNQGTANSSTMETQWLKLAGVQGFERVWRALLVGQGLDSFTLTLQAKYDYAGTYTETAATFSLSPAGAPWQVRHHMVTQKCEAVKFLLTDAPQPVQMIPLGGLMPMGSGRGMSLTDLTLEYGTKKGARKLPAAQTG